MLFRSIFAKHVPVFFGGGFWQVAIEYPPFDFSIILLGQWLNFELFVITYLVGKIKFKLLFQGSIG